MEQLIKFFFLYKTKSQRNIMIDAMRPYRRIEIDKVFTKAKAVMHTATLLRGKAIGLDKAHYQDIYTGKELIGSELYDY